MNNLFIQIRGSNQQRSHRTAKPAQFHRVNSRYYSSLCRRLIVSHIGSMCLTNSCFLPLAAACGIIPYSWKKMSRCSPNSSAEERGRRLSLTNQPALQVYNRPPLFQAGLVQQSYSSIHSYNNHLTASTWCNNRLRD